MMLPKLPKKNKKKEADFGTTIFRKWLLDHPPLVSGTYELKTTFSDSIPFSCVEDIQIDASLSVKYSKYLIRNLYGTPGAPDYSYYTKAPAWIVILYVNRGFVFIDIDAFLKEKKQSKKKSLTWERAVAIATTKVG